MALPSSGGSISIGQIRTELGTSNGSLRTLSSMAGKSTPDAMSEFWGYSAAVTVTVLLQAGGGGGGGGWPGGGGGGGAGEAYQTTMALSGSSYGVTVGGGGAYAGSQWYDDNWAGGNGGDTSFNGVSVRGGGGGGSGNGDVDWTDSGRGLVGGCAGGKGLGAANEDGRVYAAPYIGFGNNSGICFGAGGNSTGGGGTGTVGGSSQWDGQAGFGGDGYYFSEFAMYSGGGGGGGNWTQWWVSNGGQGGGGNGGGSSSRYDVEYTAPTPGAAGYGGGGGGIPHVGSPGRNGSGGSGAVRIKYAGSPVFSGGSISQSGGYTYHVFTSSGTLTKL